MFTFSEKVIVLVSKYKNRICFRVHNSFQSQSNCALSILNLIWKVKCQLNYDNRLKIFKK